MVSLWQRIKIVDDNVEVELNNVKFITIEVLFILEREIFSIDNIFREIYLFSVA